MHTRYNNNTPVWPCGYGHPPQVARDARASIAPSRHRGGLSSAATKQGKALVNCPHYRMGAFRRCVE
eukprot:2785830-Pyramimonas_sp.AAC.2